MESHYHRGGLVGPVLLIGIGLILLAQNLGWVGADIWWNLLRMWPLILVAIGIDLLIPRRSGWGTLLSLVLVVAVFIAGFQLSGIRIGGARSVETETLSVPAGEASSARIRFEPPMASLELKALQGSDALLEGTVPKTTYGRVLADSAVSGGAAEIDVAASGSFLVPVVGSRDETWRFGVSPEVPLDLEVSSGVGLIEADLTGLTVRGLDIETGVGRITITLPAGGDFSGRVSGGVGQTVIVVPEGAAVRVVMTTGLGGVSTPEGNRPFDLGDNEYTSPGFGAAQNRIELTVEQAIGSIVIRKR
jgi:LiaI-LiaF-like transmembrane region